MSVKVPVKRPPCGQAPTQVAVSKLPKLSYRVEHEHGKVTVPEEPPHNKTVSKPSNIERGRN